MEEGNNDSHSTTRTMTRIRRNIFLIFGVAIALLHQFRFSTRNRRYYRTSLKRGPYSNLSHQQDISSSSFAIEGNVNQSKSISEEKFVRYDKVAIVTKIHGPHQWKLVVQSMCLLHYAYNHKVGYDIIIFTAEPILSKDVDALQQMLAPVNVSIVVDNRGLQEEIAALTPVRYENFIERCNLSSPKNLTWFSDCRGELYGRGKPTRLAYAWQAEFRSIRVWHHPALADYKYMVWLDTDGFCTKPWTVDPVAYFIDNDGIIMFDHFPQGTARNVQSLILKAFNASVCDLKLNKKDGHLERTLIHNALPRTEKAATDHYKLLGANQGRDCTCPDPTITPFTPPTILPPTLPPTNPPTLPPTQPFPSNCNWECYYDRYADFAATNISSSCRDRNIPNIHGFMHITNLDFYRSQKVRQGLETLLGDCFLCRFPDDQLSVTLPAAIFEPNRSWEVRSKGFKLDIFHNFALDGIDRARPPGFIKYWDKVAKNQLPTTDDGMHTCKIDQRD